MLRADAGVGSAARSGESAETRHHLICAALLGVRSAQIEASVRATPGGRVHLHTLDHAEVVGRGIVMMIGAITAPGGATCPAR